MNLLKLSALAVLAFAVYTPAAHAYIDPTAAGAALQSLYVLVISAMMFIVLLPQKVAAFFQGVKAKFKPNKPSLPAADADAPTP
jgi:hypothetical protein